MELGDIVNRISYRQKKDHGGFLAAAAGTRPHHNAQLQPNPPQKKARWDVVLLILAAILICVYSSAVLIVNYAIHPNVPTPNTDKVFDEFEIPIDDIAEDVIPYVQNWFQMTRKEDHEHETSGGGTSSIGAGLLESSAQGLNDVTTPSCLELYYQELKDFIPTTSPSYVELILRNFGNHMYRSPSIRKVLHDLLTEPQDLNAIYEESQSCLGDNQPFVALACVASESFIAPPDLSDEDARIIFQYAVNLAAVLEVLTKHLENDYQALNEMVEAMVTSRRKDFEAFIEMNFPDDDEYFEFTLAKYRTMAHGVQTLLSWKSNDEIPPSQTSSTLVQMNILEAVKVDLDLGRRENAQAGLAIAANTRVGAFIKSHEVLDQLGKEWIDAYIAWNFVFVFTSTKAPDIIGKLLMPSISCTRDSYVVQRFFQRRGISLSLALMHIYEAPPKRANNDDSNITVLMKDPISPREASVLEEFYENLRKSETVDRNNLLLVDALGQSNVKSFALTDPDEDTVFKMLYTLCGEQCHGPSLKVTDTAFPSIFFENNDDLFFVYLGFINWITVVVAGISLEMFMVLIYLKDGWTEENETYHKAAQYSFSILALVTLGLASARNYLSLFTLIVGCWKFGFPETVATMYCALYDTDMSKVKRFCIALDSTGTLLHHSAASLLICMLLTGNATPDRFVVDPILILCLHHLCIPLHYYHKVLSMAILSVLEFWFQWVVLSNFEHYTSNHWTVEVAASVMLLAHWMWMVSGTLLLMQSTSTMPFSRKVRADD